MSGQKTASKRPSIIRRKRTAIVRRQPPTLAEAIEKVLIGGDLAPLNVEQRLDYYKKVCQSLGLNPLTRPFDYIAYNGKMTLYARRDCTDQLRRIHGVSVTSMKKDIVDGMYMVEVEVKNKDGRTDTGTGAVSTTGLKALDLANAIMKAETKAKRRATLSICGLGFLDQSEIDGIGEYNEVTPGGRLITTGTTTGTVEAAQNVAKRKIKEHEEGKVIDVKPELQAPEALKITPWKEGRAALSGPGLAIIKAEIEPESLKELGIVQTKDKVVHMPAANVFKLIDRAKLCNVEAVFEEPISSAAAPERAGGTEPQRQAPPPAQYEGGQSENHNREHYENSQCQRH